MYETKPFKSQKSHELCSLTNPKSNGVVKMYPKDQPICSESRLESLESVISRLESIWVDFSDAAEINAPINDIINDKDDTLFLGLDRLQDVIESKIKEINELPAAQKLTKHEISSAHEEMREPENQTPFGAGSPSLNDYMEII